MEMFKAVEKEMKTKAFSKEGLSAAAKLDPKEKEKMEMCQFISDMVDEIGRQLESNEAETETLQAGLKRGKKDTAKGERLTDLEKSADQHKWHMTKLEVLLRSLENGSVEVDQVKDIEDGIKYYVENNSEADFVEDDSLYDDLNLEEEEDMFGVNNDNDKGSSQDAQSIHDDPPDDNPRTNITSGPKGKQVATEAPTTGRRPSVQLKSPLPALSTLHASLPGNVNGKQSETMKPAPLPTIPTGQPLKYASAAAAAAASDKSGVGISPLPPPPGSGKSLDTASPAITAAQPVIPAPSPAAEAQQARHSEPAAKRATPAPREEPKPVEPSEPTPPASQPAKSTLTATASTTAAQPQESSSTKGLQPPSPDSGIAGIALSQGDPSHEEEEESIYHLPSSLSDLLESFEETKQRAKSDQPFDLGMLNASRLTCPTPLDAEKPNHYQPQNPYAYTPAHYPQEPLPIFDDPRLYSRIDTDSLFYAFYYRQGTYQQYLAAKALKSQSWRFHKQYQTWFQRHEEPKNITEEFEQGTYRFFDYESTW
jgi:CCR4-NOT transcription complex subunit 3